MNSPKNSNFVPSSTEISHIWLVLLTGVRIYVCWIYWKIIINMIFEGNINKSDILGKSLTCRPIKLFIGVITRAQFTRFIFEHSWFFFHFEGTNWLKIFSHPFFIYWVVSGHLSIFIAETFNVNVRFHKQNVMLDICSKDVINTLQNFIALFSNWSEWIIKLFIRNV